MRTWPEESFAANPAPAAEISSCRRVISLTLSFSFDILLFITFPQKVPSVNSNSGSDDREKSGARAPMVDCRPSVRLNSHQLYRSPIAQRIGALSESRLSLVESAVRDVDYWISSCLRNRTGGIRPLH